MVMSTNLHGHGHEELKRVKSFMGMVIVVMSVELHG